VVAAHALGPHPDLARGLLARQIQRPLPAFCPAVGHLEQQGRLADARIAGQKHHRAGHDAAAEDAVELGEARRRAGVRLGADVAPSDGMRVCTQ